VKRPTSISRGPLPRSRTIKDLAFRSNAAGKASLGFEIFQLADLYRRADRGELDHALTTPGRLRFNTLFVGLEGAGRHIVDFESCSLGAGVLTVAAAGRVHQFLPDRGVNAWMILFSPELIAQGAPPGTMDPVPRARVLSPLWSHPALPVGERAHELVALCERMDEEFRRPLDHLQPALLASLVRVVVCHAERLLNEADATTGRRPVPGVLERLFELIDRDFAKTRSVAHYAKAVRVSPRRLGELLEQHGFPHAKELICERVVLEQKRLLAHADTPVKELASLTGFDDATNCVKFFRRRVGLTPLAFRRSLENLTTPRRRRN
jgi:AraC-like DNA-binding protein